MDRHTEIMLRDPRIKNCVRIGLGRVSCGDKAYVGVDRDVLDACIFYGIQPSQIHYGHIPRDQVI